MSCSRGPKPDQDSCDGCRIREPGVNPKAWLNAAENVLGLLYPAAHPASDRVEQVDPYYPERCSRICFS